MTLLPANDSIFRVNENQGWQTPDLSCFVFFCG
jgi:hypothetical protein